MKSCDQQNQTTNKDNLPRQVVFLCLRNRVRSVFAEFFIRDMLEKKNDGSAEKIVLSSAGFYPGEIQELLHNAGVPDPVPFYGIDMPEYVRDQI